MSPKEKVIKIIGDCKPFLKKQYNVEKIGIFGSFRRGEATKKSDVDVLVKFSKPIGLEFLSLKSFLEKKLGKKIDLATTRALKPQFKSSILKETKYL